MTKTKYAPSIMDNEEKCFITKRTDNLHRHEIFFGTGQRETSIKNGLWVHLTGEKHNMPDKNGKMKGVHHNRELDLWLKREAQTMYESIFGHNEFLKLFHGKSWL